MENQTSCSDDRIFQLKSRVASRAVVSCAEVIDVRRGVLSRSSQPVLSRETTIVKFCSLVVDERSCTARLCVVVRCDVIVSLSVLALYFALVFCVLMIL